jgi:uncharacterized protein (TIGR02117 family)
MRLPCRVCAASDITALGRYAALQVASICLLVIVTRAPAMALWACTAEEPSCKPVFVVYDTWHAAIVLLKADIPLHALPELVDFAEADFVEFSWGDKDYFPDPNAGIFTGLKAAFWSSGSVLHVVGFNGPVKLFYPTAKIVELRLSTHAYGRLLDYLFHTFSRPVPGGRAQASAGLFAYSRFYPATHKFSLLKTCNTWVAEALKAAGLPVSPGHVMTADSVATQLSGLGVRE